MMQGDRTLTTTTERAVINCGACDQPVLDDEDAYRGSAVKGTSTYATRVDSQDWATHTRCTRIGGQQKIHIWAIGPDFSQVCARIVQPDGTEVNISSIIRSCTIKIEEGGLNTALVEFEGVEFDVLGYTAEDAAPVH
jgi:hypothetical protein